MIQRNVVRISSYQYHHELNPYPTPNPKLHPTTKTKLGAPYGQNSTTLGGKHSDRIQTLYIAPIWAEC